MLPIYQKIEANINHSFYVEHMKFKYFPNPLQFHPEIEILMVIKGTGTRFVGDSIDRFKPGDIVMIGENVPHVWYSDEKYTQKNSNLLSEIIFILFRKEIFGERFWQLPESKNILEMIKLSQRGITLKGDTKIKISSLMNSISNATGFKRVSLLFTILELIASQKEFKLLASPAFQKTINLNDSDRLNKVYQYVTNNYHHDLSLEKAAEIANLSIPAFCRYFKKRTNKTFIRLLNEIRIAHACTLLLEKDLSVASICYNCGYTSVSYFIKKFKEITGFTPLSYKKKYLTRLLSFSEA
jgi:AraC-like DNA-binding protein